MVMLRLDAVAVIQPHGFKAAQARADIQSLQDVMKEKRETDV